MDGTRAADIDYLRGILNDPAESDLHKRQARRTYQRIMQKINDPMIRRHRERLVRATRAGDVDEVEKISTELSDYELRKYGPS